MNQLHPCAKAGKAKEGMGWKCARDEVNNIAWRDQSERIILSYMHE